jgi:hypothetical protein
MIPEYSVGGVLVATVPVTAFLAFIIALVVHRLLVALRFYRWVWHPVLFDTAVRDDLVPHHPLSPPVPQGLLP